MQGFGACTLQVASYVVYCVMHSQVLGPQDLMAQQIFYCSAEIFVRGKNITENYTTKKAKLYIFPKHPGTAFRK